MHKRNKIRDSAANRRLQVIMYVILTFAVLCCILPFVLLIMASFTDENAIIRNGYSFWPEKFSLDAYKYLWQHVSQIGKAYGVSVIITVVGTTVSLFLTLTLGYVLSRRDLPGTKVLNFLVVFCMLFNGGLVATYLVYVDTLHIKNTILALIIPTLLMNCWNVMLAKSYFQNSIPYSIIEAARIDGAGEVTTFVKVVLPLSLPITATIALFVGVAYWNDWFNGMIYITKSDLYSYQNLLTQMMLNIQALKTMTESDVVVNIPSSGVRMAIATIGVIPILIAYPFFQKYFVKGIAIGAVKE